jgi:putative sterol carrier protein
VLTYEAKLFLGDIPVVTQGSPSIVKPQEVIQALKSNNLAVIKNHGVVSMGRDFREALNLVETLEEAVRVAAVARLFGKEEFDSLDVQLKQSLSNTYEESGPYTMFSREHIQRIVELVNRDEFIASKGEELGLTVELAIAMEGVGSVYKFSFENGRIVRLDLDGDAPFVISAPRQVWEQVFLGRLDPFVATTQGRMKLKGELGKLARWYVPFARLFELFRQVKITQ